jgi:enoyl-CoA hydratase/carnithine racemase
MASELVEVVQDGAVRRITLRRREKANALNPEMFDALTEAFSAEPAPDERVAVLSSEGPIFCAGVDLRYISAREVAPSPSPFEEVLEAMESYPLPVVAVVQGAAIAGGMQLAFHCDFVVASTDASFGMSLVQIGIAPVWRVAKKVVDVMGPALAREILLRGDTVPAARLAALGTIYRAVEPGELDAAANELIERLAANAPLSLRATKPLLVRLIAGADDVAHDDLDDLVDVARNSTDALEGMAARLEKRPATFTGA